MIIYIELDTIEPTAPEFMAKLEQLGINAEIIQEEGPGGGHPLVGYTGQEAAIACLLEDEFGLSLNMEPIE